MCFIWNQCQEYNKNLLQNYIYSIIDGSQIMFLKSWMPQQFFYQKNWDIKLMVWFYCNRCSRILDCLIRSSILLNLWFGFYRNRRSGILILVHECWRYQNPCIHLHTVHRVEVMHTCKNVYGMAVCACLGQFLFTFILKIYMETPHYFRNQVLTGKAIKIEIQW